MSEKCSLFFPVYFQSLLWLHWPLNHSVAKADFEPLILECFDYRCVHGTLGTVRAEQTRYQLGHTSGSMDSGADLFTAQWLPTTEFWT